MCTKVRIIFFGDLALIKGIGDVAHAAAEETFGDIPDLLKTADIVVGNLEAPHPGDGSINHLKKPYIIADEKEFCKILVLKPDVLTLANNHIFDALEPGYEATVDFLKANDISFLGAGETAEEASKPVIIERNGLKIGFLSYVSEDTNPKIFKNLKGALNVFSRKKAIDDIKRLKQIVNFVVVLLHWGVDYCHFPSLEQRETALSLSSIGADLIVGNHAHVIQPVERLNRAIVAYGLGNFYFPDFMQDDRPREWHKENKESLLLDVTLDKRGTTTIAYHRTRQNKFKVKLESAGIQNYICRIRYISTLLRWKLLWESYLQYRVKKELVYRYLFKRSRSPISQLFSLKLEHIRRLFASQN
jgi:poly-gamma-glutamate synthesis protein (capsule biosynthesis protein)